MEDCDALAADYVSVELILSKLTCWRKSAAPADDAELNSAMARLRDRANSSHSSRGERRVELKSALSKQKPPAANKSQVNLRKAREKE
jgi:hypothetical protein